MRPFILDFDQSVEPFAAADIVPLSAWQETIRFGCTRKQLQRLAACVAPHLPTESCVYFLGSGDFHHVSRVLIGRAVRREPLEIVVLDNHPDNMRYPFGIHCGSWVRHVLELRPVVHVHVVGITSTDVSLGRLWENYLGPIAQGRLTYWYIGKQASWPRALPFVDALRTFPDTPSLLDAFAAYQVARDDAVYLSIDKDVLAPDVVTTNWDQGAFRERDLHAVIRMLKSRIVGCDVTGELSDYRYRNPFKRWLAARDAQPHVQKESLERARQQHAEVNRRLLQALAA